MAPSCAATPSCLRPDMEVRRLEVPGIEPLTGAGVFYGAALTEAAACRGKDVLVVGGANSAGQAALSFARYARRVTILVRGDALSEGMSQYLVDRVTDAANIEVLSRAEVVGVHGADRLEAVDVACGGARSGAHSGGGGHVHLHRLDAEIRHRSRPGGARPLPASSSPALTFGATAGCRKSWPLERDPFLLETSLPGIFAAGDVRFGSAKRVARRGRRGVRGGRHGAQVPGDRVSVRSRFRREEDRAVPPEELVTRLKEHRTLGGMPPEELAWVAAHGYVRRFETGDLLHRSGVPLEGLHIILSGHIAIYVDRGEGLHKVLEWRGGDVSGRLPYSRMKGSPGDVLCRGTDRDSDGACRAPPRADPAVPGNHGDPRARHGGSCAPFHFQRPARREDEVPRQAGGRAGPRAQQSRLGRRAEREVPVGRPGRGGGGVARTWRRPADARRSSAALDAVRESCLAARAAGKPFADRRCRPRRFDLRMARSPGRRSDPRRAAGGDGGHAARARPAGRGASRRAAGCRAALGRTWMRRAFPGPRNRDRRHHGSTSSWRP